MSTLTICRFCWVGMPLYLWNRHHRVHVYITGINYIIVNLSEIVSVAIESIRVILIFCLKGLVWVCWIGNLRVPLFLGLNLVIWRDWAYTIWTSHSTNWCHTTSCSILLVNMKPAIIIFCMGWCISSTRCIMMLVVLLSLLALSTSWIGRLLFFHLDAGGLLSHTFRNIYLIISIYY